MNFSPLLLATVVLILFLGQRCIANETLLVNIVALSCVNFKFGDDRKIINKRILNVQKIL